MRRRGQVRQSVAGMVVVAAMGVGAPSWAADAADQSSEGGIAAQDAGDGSMPTDAGRPSPPLAAVPGSGAVVGPSVAGVAQAPGLAANPSIDSTVAVAGELLAYGLLADGRLVTLVRVGAYPSTLSIQIRDAGGLVRTSVTAWNDATDPGVAYAWFTADGFVVLTGHESSSLLGCRLTRIELDGTRGNTAVPFSEVDDLSAPCSPSSKTFWSAGPSQVAVAVAAFPATLVRIFDAHTLARDGSAALLSPLPTPTILEPVGAVATDDGGVVVGTYEWDTNSRDGYTGRTFIDRLDGAARVAASRMDDKFVVPLCEANGLLASSTLRIVERTVGSSLSTASLSPLWEQSGGTAASDCIFAPDHSTILQLENGTPVLIASDTGLQIATIAGLPPGASWGEMSARRDRFVVHGAPLAGQAESTLALGTWSLPDRTCTTGDPAATQPRRLGDTNCDGVVRVAILGDSYISGEGSATSQNPYLPGTDDPGNSCLNRPGIPGGS